MTTLDTADICSFDCNVDEDCLDGLLCAKQHSSTLLSLGLNQNTADCDFLPDTYVACVRATLLLEMGTVDLFAPPATATPDLPVCLNPLNDCDSANDLCCSGYTCQWHGAWGKNVCQVEDGSCAMMHEDCTSSSDCCSFMSQNECLYHPGFQRNVCQDPNDEVCLNPLNDCDSADDLCCSGYTCQWHANWVKNVCQVEDGSCAMMHEDCTSSSDCCSGEAADTCRYLDWLGRNACQTPA